MRKSVVYSLLFLVIASMPASAQDLNKLRERAAQLWKERLQANRPKVEAFIEKERRSDVPMFENVREAEVSGLEFTSDKSKVLVTTKAKVLVPTVGNVDQTVTESWVWTSGNWFVRSETVSKPFQATAILTKGTIRSSFSFQLLDRKIDVGAHTQGDKISGIVRFAAPRSMVEVIRARGLDGFRVGTIRWIDDKSGEFDFTLDSSLLSRDIEATVAIEAVGPERVFEITNVTENLSVVGRIEGRIGLSQLPQTAEAQNGRFVELEIRNVGKVPFRVEGIRSLDSNFVVPDLRMPLSLSSDEAVKVAVSYPKQPALIDGEFLIQLSEGVLPSNSVLFRVKGPITASATTKQPLPLDRSQLDALVEEAREAERARSKR